MGCGCSHITWVAYAIATNGDAGEIGVFFLGSNCADHRGVGDLFATITGDVFVINNKEGIRDFYALDISVCSCFYALAEASHLVGEGLVPNFDVFRVVAQLAVLKDLSAVFIEDIHVPERYYFTEVGAAGGLGWG